MMTVKLIVRDGVVCDNVQQVQCKQNMINYLLHSKHNNIHTYTCTGAYNAPIVIGQALNA